MDNLLANRSFVLWIKGECSQEEQEYWDEWLKKDPEHKTFVIEAREIIQAVSNEHDAPQPREELEKLDKLIDQYEYRKYQSDRANYHKTYRRSRGTIAAAVILFVVVIGTVVAYQNVAPEEKKTAEQASKNIHQEYSTNYGEKLTFRLSDGSNIILNANSELTFSSKVEKGLNTEVWLKGEAFFDIAGLGGDQRRTFTVHTENGSIQVLGTRFAVNTFREQTQAVLEEGKIRIDVRDKSIDRSSNYLLKPGEMAQFKAYDNKITVKKVNTSVYSSWTEDKLLFENTPMEQVSKRIEHTFGIEVKVDDSLAGQVLSGSIKSGNLKVLTEALREILNTKIEQQGDVLVIGRR